MARSSPSAAKALTWPAVAAKSRSAFSLTWLDSVISAVQRRDRRECLQRALQDLGAREVG